MLKRTDYRSRKIRRTALLLVVLFMLSGFGHAEEQNTPATAAAQKTEAKSAEEKPEANEQEPEGAHDELLDTLKRDDTAIADDSGKTEQADKAKPPRRPIASLLPALQAIPYHETVGEEVPYFKGLSPIDGETLAEKLAMALAREEMEGVEVGLLAYDLVTGELIIEKNSDKRFVPASNQKLLTTAAALETLGADYRFKTTFLSEAEIDNDGVLKGDLTVVGGGDPWLVVEQIYRMALDLYSIGLRRIEGDIIIDDTFFDKQRKGPGWETDDTDYSYMAPMGGLSANFNSVGVFTMPSEPGQKPVVTVIPQTRYIELVNEAVTSNGRWTRLIVGAPKNGEMNKVVVRGRIHPKAGRRVSYLKIDNPPLYAGWLIHDIMKQIEIKTTGYIKIRQASPEAKPLYTFHSPPLTRLVSYVNKYSNNHMAEQLVKTMGKEIKGEGSWAKGMDVIREFIGEKTGYPSEKYTIQNGSGLGDVNFVSPLLLVEVLRVMHENPQLSVDYIASMAVAGRDGTLRSYFEEGVVTELMRAKTGSLEEVIALSGYLVGRNGHTLAVSLLLNQCKGKNKRVLREIQQEIIRLLASYDPDKSRHELADK